MTDECARIAVTDHVKAVQEQCGSRAAIAQAVGQRGGPPPLELPTVG